MRNKLKEVEKVIAWREKILDQNAVKWWSNYLVQSDADKFLRAARKQQVNTEKGGKKLVKTRNKSRN